MKYQDFSVMVKAVGVWQDPTRGMMNHVKILIDKEQVCSKQVANSKPANTYHMENPKERHMYIYFILPNIHRCSQT